MGCDLLAVLWRLGACTLPADNVAESGLGLDCIGPLLGYSLLVGLTLCGELSSLFIGHSLDLGLECGLVVLEFLGLLAYADNLHFLDCIALSCGVNNFLAFDNMTEHCMLSVKPRCRHMGYEELASVCVGAAVCHGDDTRFVVLEAYVKFVRERVAWTACAVSTRVAALNHKVLLVAICLAYYTVELKTVVEWLSKPLSAVDFSFGQTSEVHYCDRHLLKLQLEQYLASVCDDLCI